MPTLLEAHRAHSDHQISKQTRASRFAWSLPLRVGFRLRCSYFGLVLLSLSDQWPCRIPEHLAAGINRASWNWIVAWAGKICLRMANPDHVCPSRQVENTYGWVFLLCQLLVAAVARSTCGRRLDAPAGQL